MKLFGEFETQSIRPISTILVSEYFFEKSFALKCEKFLEPMLCLDPDERISAEDALKSDFISTFSYGDNLLGYGARQ